MNKSCLITVIVSSTLVMSACGTTQSARQVSRSGIEPAGSPVQPGAVPPGKSAPTIKPANPVTLALRKDAKAALDKGDTIAATRLLERALRIDAREADTYLLFARLRKTEGDNNAALQLIDKGLSLRASPNTARALRKLRQSIEVTDTNS